MEPPPSKLAFEALKPIPSPPGALFKEFRIAFLPFILFAIVAGITLQVWRGYVGPSSLVGEVESVKSVIASINAGDSLKSKSMLSNVSVLGTLSPKFCWLILGF